MEELRDYSRDYSAHLLRVSASRSSRKPGDPMTLEVIAANIYFGGMYDDPGEYPDFVPEYHHTIKQGALYRAQNHWPHINPIFGNVAGFLPKHPAQHPIFLLENPAIRRQRLKENNPKWSGHPILNQLHDGVHSYTEAGTGIIYLSKYKKHGLMRRISAIGIPHYILCLGYELSKQVGFEQTEINRHIFMHTLMFLVHTYYEYAPNVRLSLQEIIDTPYYHHQAFTQYCIGMLKFINSGLFGYFYYEILPLLNTKTVYEALKELEM